VNYPYDFDCALQKGEQTSFKALTDVMLNENSELFKQIYLHFHVIRK
jgi:hypothetical protein